MKVFAIYSVKSALTPEQRKEHMSREVPATLKLYLESKIEQFWFRQDPQRPGVIFLMNVESFEQAKVVLDALPLSAAKLMTFDLMPVGPLAPLGRLIQAK